MRISDWSSDVCSSDLPVIARSAATKQPSGERTGCGPGLLRLRPVMTANMSRHLRYGSASSPPLVTAAASAADRERSGVAPRLEESRVGNDGARTGRYRWIRYH